MFSISVHSEDNPSYLELGRAVRDIVKKSFWETFPERKESQITFVWNISLNDILCVGFVTIVLAVLRHLATEWIFKPIGHRYSLTPANRQKLPESAWRFSYFFFAWIYSCYVVLISGKYEFFQKPSTVWHGWNIEENPPGDLYILYVVQSAFYIHFSYTTLFLDTWKKDSFVMLLHHIISLALIVFSHSLRYHTIAGLIFFLHDICDVFLEFAKLNIYFKIQGKRLVKWHEILANASFSCFVVTWITARLYWYPVKVLYAASYHVERMEQVMPFILPLNVLLWGILILHIYWSMFILMALYRIVTGQTGELEDSRDFEETERVPNHLTGENVSYGDDCFQNRTVGTKLFSPQTYLDDDVLGRNGGEKKN